MDNVNILSSKINRFTKNKITINLFWQLFLPISILFLYFAIDIDSQSLIAHDEGLYSRRAKLIVESNNWFTPFSEAHHKTVGSYWGIAIAIKLFGANELSVRIPSILFSFISLLIVYLMAKELFNSKVGILSIILLISTPLWIQYSRYAGPDIIYVCFFLTSLYFLIKALSLDHYHLNNYYWFFCGSALSICFFIRSYMIIIPLISIFPYIIFNLIRSRRKSSFLFVAGILSGALPSILNLYLAFQAYGSDGIFKLFSFARNQAMGLDIYSLSLFSSLKFILLSYPVTFFISLLIPFYSYRYRQKTDILLWIFPLTTFIIISLMSKSYPHYYLVILPSLSILAASYIQNIKADHRSTKIRYAFLYILATILLIYSIIFLLLLLKPNLVLIGNAKGTPFILIIILLINYIYILFKVYSKRTLNTILLRKISYFIAIPQFVVLSLLFNFGIIGNPNHVIKNFILDNKVSQIINKNTVYVYRVNSKSETLLSFYLPKYNIINNLQVIRTNSFLITSHLHYKTLIKNSDYQISIIYKFGSNYLLQISNNG